MADVGTASRVAVGLGEETPVSASPFRLTVRHRSSQRLSDVDNDHFVLQEANSHRHRHQVATNATGRQTTGVLLPPDLDSFVMTRTDADAGNAAVSAMAPQRSEPRESIIAMIGPSAGRDWFPGS